MTLKQFYQEILFALKDDFWDDDVSPKVLEKRISDFVLRLGVEMLIADEVQHLQRRANDANEVTDRLKVFLDRGIVALVLVGDEDSIEFFRSNGKLAARLGDPLELLPLDVKGSAQDAAHFKNFCRKVDAMLVENKIFTESAELTPAIFSALYKVSSGHVGRIARLYAKAASIAVKRGASCVEPYDLSGATRTYAIGASWIATDPFSRQAA